MKRFFCLVCALLLVSFSLCSCMDNTVNKVKDKASEAISDLKKDMEQNSTENDGLLGAGSEVPETIVSTVLPSDSAEMNTTAPTDENMLETMWDEMVENGEVKDGDGNVGDLENYDDDANVDTDAVDQGEK